ncbi:MAG: hypothetical protein ACFFCQ_05445 [Promethearchaeota archaeon]
MKSMRNLWVLFTVTLLSFTVFVPPNVVTEVNAISLEIRAPPFNPAQTVILFDFAHDPYLNETHLTNLTRIIKQQLGFEVRNATSGEFISSLETLESESLEQDKFIGILVLIASREPFQNTNNNPELKLIQRFLEKGGGLLMLGLPENRSIHLNPVAEALSFRFYNSSVFFREKSINNTHITVNELGIVKDFEDVPFTTNVSQILYDGCYLGQNSTITNPNVTFSYPLIWGGNGSFEWLEDFNGTFKGKSANFNYLPSENRTLGVTVELEKRDQDYGARIIGFGSGYTFNNSYIGGLVNKTNKYPLNNNTLFIKNMLQWLAHFTGNLRLDDVTLQEDGGRITEGKDVHAQIRVRTWENKTLSSVTCEMNIERTELIFKTTFMNHYGNETYFGQIPTSGLDYGSYNIHIITKRRGYGEESVFAGRFLVIEPIEEQAHPDWPLIILAFCAIGLVGISAFIAFKLSRESSIE